MSTNVIRKVTIHMGMMRYGVSVLRFHHVNRTLGLLGELDMSAHGVEQWCRECIHTGTTGFSRYIPMVFI